MNEAEEIFEVMMATHFQNSYDRHQTTEQEIQRANTRQDTKKITVFAGHIIFKLQKTKDKKKTLKETRGKNHLNYRIRMTVDFSEEPCMQEGSDAKSVERKPPTLNSVYNETILQK